VGFTLSLPFLASHVSGAHVSISASTRYVNATLTLNVLLAAMTLPTREKVCPAPLPDTIYDARPR